MPSVFLAIWAPLSNFGVFSRKKGPSRLALVASSILVLSCMMLTSAERPIVSESRMNSCRAGVQAWPTLVMNSMPLIHSAGVRLTSRAKACRCRTAASMTSFMRASGVVAICSSTASVIVCGVYARIGVLP